MPSANHSSSVSESGPGLSTITPGVALDAAATGAAALDAAALDAAATVRRSPLRTAGGWARAVELGPGMHEVQMSYDPSLSLVGAAVTLLALLAFFGVRRWAK